MEKVLFYENQRGHCEDGKGGDEYAEMHDLKRDIVLEHGAEDHDGKREYGEDGQSRDPGAISLRPIRFGAKLLVATV